MRGKLLSGVLITTIYYIVGYLSAILINVNFKQFKSDLGGPGLDFLFMILFIIGGFIWLIISIIRFILDKKNQFNKGTLIVHFLVFLSIIVYYSVLSFEVKYKPNEDFHGSVTIEQREGLKIITTEAGDTLFYKLNDSVLIDNMNK